MKPATSYGNPFVLTSLTHTIASLITSGYKLQFRREAGRLWCIEFYRWVTPDQFTVNESHYFKEASRPNNDRMVYAIATKDGIRGILVDTCGVYADNISLEMIQKLQDWQNLQIIIHENEWSPGNDIEHANEEANNNNKVVPENAK